METLVSVRTGDDDILVGISGFGSAKVSSARWYELASLSGRTSFFLRYDAQELPWPSPTALPELYRRWSVARDGARLASEYLFRWLERWARAGRRIIVVGFSLGGYLAWEAVRRLSDSLKSQVDLILISAAIGDRLETWTGIDKMARVLNFYSTDDAILRYFYPQGVATDETPAAGLGPLTVSGSNIDNINVTDLVGRDHLWASNHLDVLSRLALGCLWGSCPPALPVSEFSVVDQGLSETTVARMYRWAIMDPGLWAQLASALDGSSSDEDIVVALDRWSLQSDRLTTLLNGGAASVALLVPGLDPSSSSRGLRVISGMVRQWIAGSRPVEQMEQSRFLAAAPEQVEAAPLPVLAPASRGRR